MSDDGRGFILYGTTQTETPPRLLTAGRLTAELSGGNLRAIRYDGVEVLRAISYLVRDRDWGTYAPDLFDLAVEETDEGFMVAYEARCGGPQGTTLDMAARIIGRPSGQLIFETQAYSETGFETNRCGFCILHPIVELAGTPVIVEHVDGEMEQTELPDAIEPWQPFKDMRAITHTVMAGVTAECRMEGDTFEMEDQRNWSDASYKTYVRPLALPWPYHIPAEELVRQLVVLTIDDSRTESQEMDSTQSNGVIRLSFGPESGIMPAIGLVITPEEAVASTSAITTHGTFGTQDLLLHFDPLAGHGMEAMTALAAVAAAHKGKTTLEIAVPCVKPLAGELNGISALVRDAGLMLDAVIVSPSVDRQSTPPGSAWPECPPLEDVYVAARAAFPDIRLGGGMLSYFTELNRKRVPADQLDFITHATNPIVHAADDISVMQTLEALPFITESVRDIYDDMPYRIGPSTIAMRQNPYGSRTMDNPDGGRIPMASRDPRHTALFGAAFALGYAAQVIEAGLEQLTLSALAGPFGLIADAGEPMPEGGLRPLAHVVAGLSLLAGKPYRQCLSANPEKLLALSATDGDGGTVVFIANLTATTVEADISGFNASQKAILHMLDETTAVAGAAGDFSEVPLNGGSLTLLPYAVARLNW